MKMPKPMAMKAAMTKGPPTPRVGGKGMPGKPHIRARKLKPVPPRRVPRPRRRSRPIPTNQAGPDPGSPRWRRNRAACPPARRRGTWGNRAWLSSRYRHPAPTLGENTPTQTASRPGPDAGSKQAAGTSPMTSRRFPLGSRCSSPNWNSPNWPTRPLRRCSPSSQGARQARAVCGAAGGLIANAFGTFDPDAPDASARWDAMVDGLVDQGATQAGQFRGRYSPAMAQKWARAYSANSAGAARSTPSLGRRQHGVQRTSAQGRGRRDDGFWRGQRRRA